MIIKYGKREHLQQILDGKLFFGNVEFFRGVKNDDGRTGVGDSEESIISHSDINWKIVTGGSFVNCSVDKYINSNAKIPIFCLSYYSDEEFNNISNFDIRKNFENYDAALIFDSENDFLENLRYSFKSKCFVHKVFYQDYNTTQALEFVKNGTSIINFYHNHKKTKYFDIVNSDTKKVTRIFETDFFKYLFLKRSSFSNQRELRICLPYETIENPKLFFVKKIKGKIVDLETLFKKEK